MAGSPYGSYQAGVITGSLIAAQGCLDSAFVQAFSLVGLDHQLTKNIQAMQKTIAETRKIESLVNQDVMSGRLK